MPEKEKGCCDFDPNGSTDEDIENFCNAPENVARIPAGKIQELGSPAMYRDGNNALLTREDFMKAHGVDPEVLWVTIKERQVRLGKKGDRAPVEL